MNGITEYFNERERPDYPCNNCSEKNTCTSIFHGCDILEKWWDKIYNETTRRKKDE